MALSDEKCKPCSKGTPPLKNIEVEDLMQSLHKEWLVVDNKLLEREFKFKNFKDAMAFTIQVGNLAEEEGHHPDILLAWGKVKITLWTHKINGLSSNDFILAAKIDALC